MKNLGLAIVSVVVIAGAFVLFHRGRSAPVTYQQKKDAGYVELVGPGGHRTALVSPSEIPSDLRDQYMDAEGHIHMANDVRKLDTELSFMDEYADFDVFQVEAEIEYWMPIYEQRLEDVLQAKLNRGEVEEAQTEEVAKPGGGTWTRLRLPGKPAKYAELGGVQYQATLEEGDDPQAQEMHDRVRWLRKRQKYLQAKMALGDE